MKRIFLTALSIFCFQVFGHRPSDGVVHGAIGPRFSQTLDPIHPLGAPIYGGLGMLVEADINRHGGVELSIFYNDQLFLIEKESKRLIERGKRLYIGMGYRHWFNRTFSLAPAFFSSYVMGDVTTLRNDFNIANPPKTSARDTVEYGFDLSLQYEAYRLDSFTILCDLRYSHSVTPKPDEDAHHYGLMVAFKYFIQAKQPESELDL